MEVLLVIGLAIFLGTLSGKTFQKIKIPQVTGYLVAGLLLGQSGFKLITPAMLDLFSPIMNLALGIIGFLLGSELKYEIFRNRGRAIYTILLGQGFFTFLIVAAVVTLVTQQLYLGIFLGAIATATDPAATADVLWESKARGPLTSILLAIVALDDLLALFIYAFGGLLAKSMLLGEGLSLAHMGHVFVELGTGMAVGIAGGAFLYWLIHFVQDRERILPFSIGIITLLVGVSAHFKIDVILASMLAGIALANIAPQESEDIVDAVKRFSLPIYIIFFVLVGARLDIAAVFGAGATFLLISFLISRAAGKMLGSYFGGMIGKAPPMVSKYLGLGLFSQAGVAIGMAISMNNNLSHMGPEAAAVGALIINVAVAGTFVFQLAGPPCVRLAVEKAKEVGRNVTEDDVIASYKVADLIENDVPVIRENTHLDAVVDLVKNSESNDFCVVDNQDRLLGSISLGALRDVLLEQEGGLNQLVLARDIAVPANRIMAADRPLQEAIDIFRRRDLDFLPVVKDEKSRELVGLIHYRYVMSEIHKEVLKRRGN